MAKRRKWSEHELDQLRTIYPKHGARFCSEFFGRDTRSIYNAVHKYQIVKEPRYTEEELENIRLNYSTKGPLGLSKEMNRSRNAIRDMAVRLGLYVGEEARKKQSKNARNHWTEKTRKDHSDFMKQFKGPLSPSWKGGLCTPSEVIRGRLYSAWKKYVFQRDDFTCRICGKHGGKLVAHHVRPFAQIRDAVIEKHPDLDFERLADLVIDAHELKDGLTLCRSCHVKHHFENGVNCGDIFPDNAEDNPQPSLGNVRKFVLRKVQRLTGEDSHTDKPDTSAPLSESLRQMR